MAAMLVARQNVQQAGGVSAEESEESEERES